jgi:hypothetical protein
MTLSWSANACSKNNEKRNLCYNVTTIGWSTQVRTIPATEQRSSHMSTPMQVDEADTKGESTSALDVYLHPLVIINISDHYTRVKVNTPAPKKGEKKEGVRIFYDFFLPN